MAFLLFFGSLLVEALGRVNRFCKLKRSMKTHRRDAEYAEGRGLVEKFFELCVLCASAVKVT
jgi:hypothetical protein